MKTFAAALIAGLTVGLGALPLALAFRIAGGAPPQTGISLAVAAGFLISALSGVRHGAHGQGVAGGRKPALVLRVVAP